MRRHLRLILVSVMLLGSQIAFAGAFQDADADYCAALNDSMARLEQQTQQLLEQTPVSEEITSEDIDKFLQSTDTLLLLIAAQSLLQESFDIFCAPLLAAVDNGTGANTTTTENASTNTGMTLLDVPIPGDLSWSGGWALVGCQPEHDYIYRPFDETFPVVQGCMGLSLEDNNHVLQATFHVPPASGSGCGQFASFDGSTLRFRGGDHFIGDFEVTATIEVVGPLDEGYLPVRISGTFDDYSVQGEFEGTGNFDYLATLGRISTVGALSSCGTAP